MSSQDGEGNDGNTITSMEFEDPSSKKKGFFAGSSKNTFLKITAIFAGVAALVLVIVLPIYFTVLQPAASATEKPIDEKTTTPTGVITIPDTTPESFPDEERFDCYPEAGATEETCLARNCTWSPGENGAPYCFFYGQRSFLLEGPTQDTSNGITSTLMLGQADSSNHYGQQFPRLTVKTSYISSSTLRIKIYPDGDRYEVPIDHLMEISKPTDALYSVEHVNENGVFGVKVTRIETSKDVFDTSVGELMFADQFLQISTRVASEYIYGFGEHMHESFKHNMNWKTYGMFARDQGVGPDSNLYGVHPYFVCMEGDGKAYGVFFVNSNAMDVTLQPTPAITYRSVGGLIDFYIFLGPSPEQVTQQYTEVIGRPYFPPYWSLGFQLCRYGYENLANLSRVVNRNLDAGIPYEIQYSDIDYMERQLDFTIDNESYYGLEDFVRNLKNDHKMRYIIILDPAISGNETDPYPPFEKGVAEDVFIKTPDGDIAWGKVWPDFPNVTVDSSKDWDYQTENYRAFAAFPDFYLPRTSTWWTDLTVDFHKRIEFDGIWIDMNEPASFTHGSPSGCPDDSKYDHPPYHPALKSSNIYDKTICMQSMQYHPTTKANTEHYNLHSLFGLSQSPPSLDACRASTGERCIVISRSTYPGSGKYAGHWLGDNASIWEHLAASIIGMLEFNLFGIPYVGADVCGFFGNSNWELCLRWMQLGAFYPFDRNHNGFGNDDQDPASYNEAFIEASKKVLETRYTLLPYLYTLFYESHMTGATVVRPLMNQFPDDNTTYAVDRQFLWGPALLITPVLDEGHLNVRGYFPTARWFDYYIGTELTQVGQQVTLNAAQDHINIHVLGGHIIPTQAPAKTTYYSRQNKFSLIVALDYDNKAIGELFWDDGTSTDTIENMQYNLVSFACEVNTLKSNVVHTGHFSENMTLDSISVMGISGDVTSLTVNGIAFTTFVYYEGTKSLEINQLELDLTNKFEIRWEIGNQWKRRDCMPSMTEENTESTCTDRGCSWDPTSSGNLGSSPQCYFSSDDVTKVPSYSLKTTLARAGSNSYTLSRNTAGNSIYGIPVEELQLDVEYQTNNRLHFKFSDPANDLFEIPEQVLNLTSPIESDEASSQYQVNITENPFSLRIARKSTGKIIFDTSAGPLIFEDKFREISTSFPSENVFGFGEHNHRRYRHDLNWKRWAIFTRDVGVVDEWNLYGHQTFYMAIDDTENGSAIGVYLHNTNAMDVTLQPTPAVTYRLTGGVLDFYIFIGGSQEEVVQEYHKFIGLPTMPPYWALGFQLSRWHYGTLDRVKEVVAEMRDAQVPFDVQYGDIDYMEAYKDFTYDKENFDGLPQFVDDLHDWGMRYIIILDPAIKIEEGYIPFEEGIKDNIYIMNPDNTAPVLSEVWPGETYTPDFTHPNSSDWWYRQCEEFYSNQGVKYDALWVDMNEPSNFQPDDPEKFEKMNCSDEYNKPLFMPNILGYWRGLHDKTICMENQQYLGIHRDFHSLYGHTMSMVTYQALEKIMPDERSLVLTRSSFAGTGKYAGHWLGDNQSLWPHIAWSIPGMLEFNLFGFPFIGADVCGFWFNTTAEMCQRWMQVGAFYPFSRNHNGKDMIPQHPTAFGPEVTASSKKVLEIRYSILPYLYTLMHKVNANGGTVVRALVHEFPSDKNTWDVDRQFLLGSGFLITPVLDEGARRITGYFPGNARWFDFHTGEEMSQVGKFVSLDAPLDFINLHLRGGTIIAMQSPNVTTTESRKNPMSLLIPLDNTESSSGELYWDDGVARNVGEAYLTVNITCQNSRLNIQILHNSTDLDVSHLYFEKITVLGIKSDNVDMVTIDGDDLNIEGSGTSPDAMYSYNDHKLEITELRLPIDQSHIVTWS